MAKRKAHQNRPRPPMPPPRGIDKVGLATLLAVAVVLVVSVMNLRAVQSVRADLEDKMDRVEDRIAKIATTPAPAAQAATPPRRGPDPNRVYEIRTAGRPAKGPASAPVTIAEFSDFQ